MGIVTMLSNQFHFLTALRPCGRTTGRKGTAEVFLAEHRRFAGNTDHIAALNLGNGCNQSLCIRMLRMQHHIFFRPVLHQMAGIHNGNLVDHIGNYTHIVGNDDDRCAELIPQIHHLADTSEYTELYRNMSDYSRMLRNEKDYDGLTGLYNRGKFMEMKRTLLRNQDEIAIFNMDVNNLKQVNDTLGHEAGDRLIRKAAESLKRIEARNVIPFRVGGDEFVVAVVHVDQAGAEKIRQTWEKALAELNEGEDDLPCTVACGSAFGEKGYDLEEVLARADQAMYAAKVAMKAERRD